MHQFNTTRFRVKIQTQDDHPKAQTLFPKENQIDRQNDDHPNT